ncbi:MAG: aromatic acid exporter family protein [Ornithinimicrobium sp.]
MTERQGVLTDLFDWTVRRLRLDQPWLPLLTSTARMTTAAVVAYLLTLWWIDGPVDLTCALTAILVVQTSAYSTVRMGMVRVGAVVTGVLVAVAVSSWVGLSWWSLGAVIAVSLLLAAVLRLGDQALETPISAMLILAVGGQEIAAETRVLTTLIGAGVGVSFNLLFPPAVPTKAVVSNVRQVARQQANSLRMASASMAEQSITRGEVGRWLGEARAVVDATQRAHEAVTSLAEVRRFNARALGAPAVEPSLRSGLEALDRSQFALRALYFTMHKEAPQEETPDDGYGEEVRIAFAVLLDNVAGAIEAFGALMEAEAREIDEDVERNLADSVDVAREAKAILTDLLMVDAHAETSLWLLRGSILVAVEQTIEPLKLEDRLRLRRELAGEAGRGPLIPIRRDMLPTHLGPGQRVRRHLRRLRAYSAERG